MNRVHGRCAQVFATGWLASLVSTVSASGGPADPKGSRLELPDDGQHDGAVEPDGIKRVRPSMGGYLEVSVFGQEQSAALSAIERVFAEFERLDVLLSEWKPKSAISAVSAAAGERAVPVDPEAFGLLETSVLYAVRTHGAFDPTFAAMWGLWTFGNDGIKRAPNKELVEERKRLIDFKSLVLDREAKTAKLLRRGMKIGLGGIAKGYATDRGVAILRAAGAKNFIIKAGGELYVAGRKKDRRFRVGVKDPRGPGAFAWIELEDEAFNTSGDYERFFIDRGVRYHHIIDPSTGYPATKSRSVTVLAKDALTADALDTAIFVLGPKEGMALIASFPGVEVLIVDAENGVHVSAGLRDRLDLSPPSAGDP